MRKGIILLVAMILAGCTLTVPVDGRLGEEDRFIGEATGDMFGNGTMTVTSSSGIKCRGDFETKTSATGEGLLDCDDGRSGTFVFNSNGTKGNGFGTLNDGQKFVFYFGNPSHTRVDP